MSGAGAITALALAGCVRESRLEPAPAATVIEEDTAIAREAGVTLVATVDEWPGDAGVLDHVTPVRVAIRNESDRPVRIQYRHFALVAPDGERFVALPPYRIEGSIREPVLAEPYEPVDGPLYDGFGVDPLYADVWPGVGVYEDELYDYDMGYYDAYEFWRMPLPTPAMRRLVLPEGVLEPGGEVAGFLYFEKVPEELPRVVLRARWVNPRTGRLLGVARIPFVVQG